MRQPYELQLTNIAKTWEMQKDVQDYFFLIIKKI